MKFNILILDDEQLVCNSLKRTIESNDRIVFTATSFKDASKILENNTIDLVLLDFKLGETDGIEVLKEIKSSYENLLVIMITAYGNIDLAVDAMKLGAYDFIQKKVDPDFILYTVQRALDNLRLKKEIEELKSSYQENACMPKIIAKSQNMKNIISLAVEYASTDSTVFIQGETGTGKGVLAEYIHFKSSRFNQPFIPINISAIPNDLIESELFGYEKGAFTGASQSGKAGLIEQANGGTLFLDEIGDLNLDIQSKLLHVLEKNEFFRLGSVKAIKVDTRFIAATNAKIEELINQNKFRKDLFYRLNVATLDIPPLRNRKDDILLLAKYFIYEFNDKFNKSVTEITEAAREYLRKDPWIGNIRELKNKIERAILLKKNNILDLDDIKDLNNQLIMNQFNGNSEFSINLNSANGKNLIQESSKKMILQALKSSNNNISKSAQLLGIPRTTLNFYIKKYNISLQ